jgi:adiponectin receptor
MQIRVFELGNYRSCHTPKRRMDVSDESPQHSLVRRKSSLGSVHELKNCDDHKHLYDNQFVLQGYRMNYSPFECFGSFFGLHNESINVWTHAFGAAVFFYLFINALWDGPMWESSLHSAVEWEFTSSYKHLFWTPPLESTLSQWPLIIFLGCSVFCMSASALFHLLCARNMSWYNIVARLDYGGIAILGIGAYLPFLYTIFYCHETSMSVYMALSSTLGSATFVFGMIPLYSMPPYRTMRVAVFSSLLIFALGPIYHTVHISATLDGILLPFLKHVAVSGVLMLIGIVVNVFQLPECLFPGHFDLFLSSHQIWHACVLASLWVYYLNVLEMYKWRGDNMCA